MLVADDDPAISRLLRTLVSSWGSEPIVVTDGDAALSELSGSSPVPRALIDWMMPGLSGLDVVRTHRSRGGEARIVMLTARDQSDDIVAGLRAGADDYVTKPFNHLELRARLMRGAPMHVVEPAQVEGGTVIGGRYRLEYLIAEGGMGSIWRASHIELGQACAVKLIRPAQVASPLARARFECEARTASQLRSPHISQIFDYGVTPEGMPYLVMEYLLGRNLADTIEAGGPLPLAAVALIASQIARGLDVAHRAGVAHRDVKPENVFLEDTGDDSVVGLPYRAKLLDFGIARNDDEAGPRVTTERGFLGTLGYASPEQIVGDEVGERSDLWSFGATLCFALTGKPPITEASHTAMMLQTLAGECVPPTDVVAELPPAVDAWAARACAVDPNRRFPDALTMARELRAISAAAGPRVFALPLIPIVAPAAAVVPTATIAWPTLLAAAFSAALVILLVVMAIWMRSPTSPRSAAQPTSVSRLVP